MLGLCISAPQLLEGDPLQKKLPGIDVTSQTGLGLRVQAQISESCLASSRHFLEDQQQHLSQLLLVHMSSDVVVATTSKIVLDCATHPKEEVRFLYLGDGSMPIEDTIQPLSSLNPQTLNPRSAL